MSVYSKDNADHFEISVESMLNQTVIPDEIVIVKDGPLNEALENTTKKLSEHKIIKFVTLEKNKGLGNALKVGLESCKNEYIARMDSDDIAVANRCEKQLLNFKNTPDLSIIGTTVAEFIDSSHNVVSYRRVPKNHIDIVRFMKKRSPFNHPSVMFKKSEVLKAGGYQHWYLNEDYYLWIRMLLNGCKFKNIDEPLLYMRISNDTFLRRGGWEYFVTQKNLFDFMLENQIINYKEYIFNNFVRFVTRLLIPNNFRAWMYRTLLRSNN